MTNASFKEHSAVGPDNPAAESHRGAGRSGRWWRWAALSIALAASPAGAQKRVHNPHTQQPTPPAPSSAPSTPPPATPAPPANPAPASPAPSTAPANPTVPASPSSPAAPSAPLPPPPAPGPPPPIRTPPVSPDASATAADAMRGLLIGLDTRQGTITVARNAFPPLTMRVAPGAAITRDGVPAPLGALEIGSSTVIPDSLLVGTTTAADGSMTAVKIKATSRDHYWYGHVTSLDPSTGIITVTRADGQRRSFHLNDRTNVLEYGAGNAPWSALHLGGIVDVVWIPGESDTSTSVLEAHFVVLDKPYGGIVHVTAPAH